MNKLLRCLAAAVAALALLPAAAQDSPKLREALKKSIPDLKVDSVRKTPYNNLYEVVIGSEIYYTDEGANFLVMGSIVDMKTKVNVTEARVREVTKVSFDQLPLDSAFKIVRGNGARKVAMFADPNCGYCKRFERDLLGVDNITVYVFLYPILAADSVEKSKAVWCSADRGKTWLDYMVRDVPLPTKTECTTPVEKNLAFGRDKKITGTPTMIFEDGERIPGAMQVADFEKRLAAAKAAPAKSPS